MQTECKLIVNGMPTTLAVKNLADVCRALGLADIPSAIALNDEVVPSCERPSTPVQDGDHIEIVTASCGG